jgi:hypothetical protein
MDQHNRFRQAAAQSGRPVDRPVARMEEPLASEVLDDADTDCVLLLVLLAFLVGERWWGGTEGRETVKRQRPHCTVPHCCRTRVAIPKYQRQQPLPLRL